MKNVLISLKGFSENEEEIEFITEGKYHSENGKYYITYKETEMTGMEGTTTTLQVKDNVVELIRKGTVNSNFIFEEGISNTSKYETQYGIFTIEIKANSINTSIDDSGGVIEMEYSLNLMDGKNSNNKFYMTIKEVNKHEYNQ